MSNIVSNDKNEKLNSLFSISLSGSNTKYQYAGIEKLLCLKEINFNEKHLIMVDIRRYVNGNPTKCGVCFTDYEYDWMANVLIQSNQVEDSYKSKNSERYITIIFKPNRSAEILQTVGKKHKKISLNRREIKKIVQNYSCFLNIVDEMEALQEGSSEDEKFMESK